MSALIWEQVYDVQLFFFKRLWYNICQKINASMHLPEDLPLFPKKKKINPSTRK